MRYALAGSAFCWAAAVSGDATSIPTPSTPARAVRARRFMLESPCGCRVAVTALHYGCIVMAGPLGRQWSVRTVERDVRPAPECLWPAWGWSARISGGGVGRRTKLEAVVL